MAIATLFLMAWLATPSLRICEMGEIIGMDVTDQCICHGPIYANAKSQLRCGGFCPEGFELQKDAPDGQPVCLRKDTTEDRLQRIEQKLDTLLQQKEGRP